jgi:hypothetical protein
MLEYILVGNVEKCRLEAEVRDSEYELLAIVYEDQSGWKTEQMGNQTVPAHLLETIKTRMTQCPNRKGIEPPQGMSKGQLSLWLMMG